MPLWHLGLWLLKGEPSYLFFFLFLWNVIWQIDFGVASLECLWGDDIRMGCNRNVRWQMQMQKLDLLLLGPAHSLTLMSKAKQRDRSWNCYENKQWLKSRSYIMLLQMGWEHPCSGSSWQQLLVALTQVWSQSEGQEGFNPNLLLTAWHTWTVQLHLPLIYWVAWMTD